VSDFINLRQGQKSLGTKVFTLESRTKGRLKTYLPTYIKKFVYNNLQNSWI
jgi:hypothetical protein